MGKWMGKNLISTKNRHNWGASTFFEIDSNKYTENNIFELLEYVIPEADNREPAKELRKRKVQALVGKKQTDMWYTTNPFREGNVFIMPLYAYPLEKITDNYLYYDTKNISLSFPTNIDDIPIQEKHALGGIDSINLKKISFYLNLMEKVFNHFQCEFGFGTPFDYLIKLKRNDPRKEIYGINYYGKKMVEQIGRETILSLQDCIIKEMSWGGIIVQLAKNPYLDIEEAKKITIKNSIWGV